MPIWPPRPEAGFTLIELLVVLGILGLAAALFASAVSQGPGRIGDERTMLALQAAITTARQKAVTSGGAVAFRPGDHAADAALQDPVFPGDQILFQPDGTSNGGTIAVAGRLLLTVDWLTGEAARAQ